MSLYLTCKYLSAQMDIRHAEKNLLAVVKAFYHLEKHTGCLFSENLFTTNSARSFHSQIFDSSTVSLIEK